MTKIKSTNNDLQNIQKTTGHQHQNIDSFKQNLPSKITPTKPHSFFTWKLYSSVIDSYKTMYFYGGLNLFVTLMFIYIFLYSFIMLMVYYISLMWINKSMRICLCKILILHICNSGPGGSMSQVVGSNSSYKPTTNTRGFAPSCVNYKKGALDSQSQVIKLTSCLSSVGGSLRVLGLHPPLKPGRHDIAEILLKVALKPN